MELLPVAIVGGGLSGLAAARTLARHGVRSVVYEAATTLGGRVRTVRRAGSKLPIELGAEFVHGAPRPLLALASAEGLELEKLRDKHAIKFPDGWSEESDFWGRFSGIIAEARHSGPEVSAAEYLDAQVHSPKDGVLSRLLVEGFHAAPLGDVSARALAEDASSGGSPRQARVQGGYDRVTEALLRASDSECPTIELGARVRRIQWSKQGVTLSGVRGEHGFDAVARRCLISVSIGVLAAPPSQGIEFLPALRHRDAALSGLAMGQVTKVVLTFGRASFPGSFDDGSFLHDPVSEFPTFWARASGDELQVTAWAGAQRAAALAGLGGDALSQRACAALARTLELHPSRVEAALIDTHHFDFTRDPLTRGAYSYVRPAGIGAAEELAKPVEDTLFFCGEALSPENSGTTSGALGSGQHAARAILSAMNHG